MRIDIIAEKNSTKLSVIKIKLETLWTKIKNQEINYIVSELINYIENSLAKIEIDEAISIDDNNDTNNGDIDFTISWLKQNQNNSFTIQISNIWSKDYDIGHSEKKQSLWIYCREYTNEKNEILLETNDFIGAINQNTWSWTFELKQTQQWIFTIKCEVNKYQDIVESNKEIIIALCGSIL